MDNQRIIQLVQTGIGAIIMSLMFWVGDSVQKSRENFIKLNENVIGVQKAVDDFKVQWQSNSAVIIDHEKRINRLEWSIKK